MAGGDYNLGTAHGTIELSAASLGRASSALDHVANRMLLVGGAAAAGLGYAIKSAGDFEQQISRFQSVANATKAEMEGIRKKALQLGQDSAYGATEVITAFAELGYAGVTTKEILAGVGDAVVYLAAAAEIPLKDAATSLVNVMRQFSIPANKAENAVNELARAANASTIDMQDLIVSMKYAGPVAAALHAPLNDVAQTLALLGNNGIRGSTAGTSLRGILIALTPTSLKAEAAMAKLGLITEDGGNLFFDSAGKMKSLAEVAQILQDHTKNLTDEEKKMAFTTIFQRRAMASALVLAKGGAAAYFELATSAQYNTTAQELMKKKLDNMKGALKILKASIETFAITIGEQLTPFLKNAAKELTRVTNWFTKLSPETKKWIVIVGGGLASMLLFLGIALKMGKGIVGMYKALKDLGGALKIVGAILKTQIVANPSILALVAIAGLIYYLWTASPKFRQFVRDFIKELGKLEVAIGGWFIDTVGSPAAKKFLDDFLTTLGGFEIGFVNFIGDTFGSPEAKNFLHDFLHQLGEVEVGFADFMLKTFGSAKAKKFLHDFLYQLGEIEVGFINIISHKDVQTFLHDFLSELGHVEVGIVLFVAKALDGIGHFGIFMAKEVGKWAVKLGSALVTFYNFGDDLIKNIAQGINDGLGALNDLVHWIVLQFPAWLGDTVATLFNKGVELIRGLWNGITEGLASLVNLGFNVFVTVVTAIGDTAKWLVNSGRDILRGLWEGIKGQMGWLIEKIKDWVGRVIDSVLGFFGIGSPSKVFADIGGHLVSGLVMGILDNAHKVQTAYGALAPPDMTASMAYSVAGGSGLGAPGGITSEAAGVRGRGRAGDSMEKHLSKISNQLASSGAEWGPPVVQVAAGVKNPTQVGMEAVRQLKAVQYRGRRRERKAA